MFSGKSEQLSLGNFVNSEEARLISDVIKYLLANGIPGSCIVVMTICNAQAIAIRSRLNEIE